MGIRDDRAQPAILQERGLEPLPLQLEGEPILEGRPMFTSFRKPRQFPLVTREQNWTANTLSNRLGIPIGEIGLALALLIPHVRNRVVIGPKWGAGESQSKNRLFKRFPQRVAPILPFPCMVQLVKDEQSGAAPASALKHIRCETDLLIGDDCAMVVAR